MIKKLLCLLVLLLTATTGAWAQSAFTAKEITSASQLTSTDDEAYVAACMPSDFLAVDADVAKAWTGAPTDGSAILIYAIDGDKIKIATFINGSNKATTGATWSIAVFKNQLTNGKFFYTTAAGYTVSLKDGTQDAGKWTVKAGTDGSFQSLPLKGVKAGTKVKLKYDGDRSMLKGVTATSDAKKEPATVTTAPTGAEIVGVGKTTALVSGGVADGGTLMYQMTTTNTKPTSTDGFSATVPTAQTITASGKVYVWYFVKADDTHSDSEIAGPVSVTLVEELTWNTTNVFNSSHQKDKLSFNKKTPLVYEGITISYSGDDPASHFYLYYAKEGKGRLQCYGQNGVKFTFTAPSGKKFVRIEMTDDVSVYSGDANWIEIEDENKLVWSGTPSNTVEIAGDDLTQLSTLNTIVFYLVDAE